MPRRATSTSFGKSRGNKRGPGNRNGVDPLIFKKRCQILAQRAADSKRLEALLSDPGKGETDEVKAADFLAALREVSNRGFGLPQQSVDVTSGGKVVSGILALPAETIHE